MMDMDLDVVTIVANTIVEEDITIVMQDVGVICLQDNCNLGDSEIRSGQCLTVFAHAMWSTYAPINMSNVKSIKALWE